MSLAWRAGEPLAAGDHGARFAAWLQAASAGASTAAGQALASPAGNSAAPLFAAADGAAWRAARSVGADDGWDAATLARAAAGGCEVVVTGQQPGFLGGPLLTLHKVATAIALAEARTAAGRPAIAVFWCGDDDDDLVEALSPVGWDPASGVLVRADGRVAARAGSFERRMVGATPAARWCAPGAALLRRQASAPDAAPLAAALASLWEEALQDGWTWSRLNVAAVRRVFTGRALAVVRGDDPDLHAAAGPFYAGIGPRRERCRDLAHERGRLLAGPAGRAPVSDRSLDHHLFTVEAGRRRPLPLGAPLPGPSQLRPGVLLRSLVQDWLLRPVAVVAGPGECAYLEQLEPLYDALGVPRCPLVPRLFAWVLPPGLDAARLATLGRGATLTADAVEQLADGLAARNAAALQDVLERELGLPAERAASLADGRGRRWRRGAAALLRDENLRQWRQRLGEAPGCVFPDGLRQERRLALASAAATWGDDLATTIIDAAHDHLAGGAAGRWREYVVS